MIANAEPKTRAASRLQNPQLRAYLALALGILCIAFSAIFTKWANVPGPVSGFYRVAIATTLLALPFLYQVLGVRYWVLGSKAQSPTPNTQHPTPIRRLTVPLAWATALAGLFFALDL